MDDNAMREPGGALIGGLHVEDYTRGMADYEAGTPPPDGLTSTSYDLGRFRAQQAAEFKADLLAKMDAEHKTRMATINAMIAEKEAQK